MMLRLITANIRGNKRKTISAVAGICISVMLIFVAINSYVSFQKMRIENAYDSYGQYNIVLHNVDKETYTRIRDWKDKDVEIGFESIVGVTDSGINLINSDFYSTRMNRYKLEEGRLPNKKSEVAISATARLDDDYVINTYKVGDTIKLNGCIYTISGILDDYNYSTTDTYSLALTKEKNETGRYNIYFHCRQKESYNNTVTELKNYLSIDDACIMHGDKIEGFLGEYKMILNDDLNRLELDGEGSLQDANIGRLLLSFAIILVLTSLILGIHIFTAYLNGRNKQQGILFSLGFSNTYVSVIYVVECIILVVIGCLAGLLSGRYLTSFLFDLVQSLRVTRLDNFNPQFTRQSYGASAIISFMGFMLALIPVIVRSMRNGVNEVIKTRRKRYRGDKRIKRNHKTRHTTAKYFFKDSYPFEKLCIYVSMVMIGLGFMLLINVNRYVNYVLEHRDEYDSEFELISDDVSKMDNFRELIPEAVYYDLIYDTTGSFYIDRKYINDKYEDMLMFEDDNSLYCEIVGVSELQYKNKIELSNDMTYEAFAASGGAIIIDNVGASDECILKELPGAVKYAERSGDLGACFAAGEINITARSSFKNWNDQRGISIIVPEELFKEKFDYTNVLFKINVTEGSEIEVAGRLNKYSYLYNYTFLDHASDYIKQQDDSTTVRVCTYGILLFVTVINLFIIIYTNVLVYIRRRDNISILMALGHPKLSIIGPMLAEVIVQSIVTSIISVGISGVLSRKLLPEATQGIVLTSGTGDILYVLLFIIVTQIAAVAVISVAANQVAENRKRRR